MLVNQNTRSKLVQRKAGKDLTSIYTSTSKSERKILKRETRLIVFSSVNCDI